MEAWRWRPGGAGGLGALASSWRGGDDLARRGLDALWRCPCGPPCVAVLSAMPSGALGALKRGAGLTLKMMTRVDARLLVAPRGATCWYGSTHASYGVSFSTEHKPHEWMNSPELTIVDFVTRRIRALFVNSLFF